MPRTTIDIEEALLRRLKQRAAAEDRALQDVVNDALRDGLARPKRDRYVFRLDGWKGEAQPGVDLTDRDKLFDVAQGR